MLSPLFSSIREIRNALSYGMQRIRRALPARVFDFNQYYRDQWVMSQAMSVPSNARVLDVGAGSTPYRRLFSHTEYIAQDFVQLLPEQLLGSQGYGKIDIVSDVCAIPVMESSLDVVI